MTIRVKLRPDKKAMIRFSNQLEEQWFINLIRSIRDSDPKTHLAIRIRDKNGEIPKLPPPKVMKMDEKQVPRGQPIITGEPLPKQKITPIGEVVKDPTVKEEKK